MKTNRRQFIQTMGASTAGLTLGGAALSLTSCASNKSTEGNDEQTLFIGDNIAIADTEYGKVQGYILRNIYYFFRYSLWSRYIRCQQVHAPTKAGTMDRYLSRVMVGKHCSPKYGKQVCQQIWSFQGSLEL